MAAEAWVTLAVEHRRHGPLHVFTCRALPRFVVRRRAPRAAYGEIRSQLATAIAEFTGFAAEVRPLESAEQFLARAPAAGAEAMSHAYVVRLGKGPAVSRRDPAPRPERMIRLLRGAR